MLLSMSMDLQMLLGTLQRRNEMKILLALALAVALIETRKD